MNESLKKIYEEHHRNNRKPGFSIMEDERGLAFRDWIGQGKKILDLGCRDGALTKHFSQGNEVLGTDIDEISLNRARELGIKTKLVDLNGDWSELAEEKFDVVTAGEIVEHLYHPEKIIKQVSEHLNEGGVFIGSVPNAFSLKNRLRYLKGSKEFTPLADPTHINHFSFEELGKKLKKEFRDVEMAGLGRYKLLAKLFPSFFAFIFVFKCKK